MNEATLAHCLSKLGFCCVREGRVDEGYEYLNEAIELRTKREKKSDETKDKVMLGACYNDIAGWEEWYISYSPIFYFHGRTLSSEDTLQSVMLAFSPIYYKQV